MITNRLFSDPSNNNKTRVISAVPYSIREQHQGCEARSVPLNVSFTTKYEYDRAHASDDPEAFAQDVRFVLGALR